MVPQAICSSLLTATKVCGRTLALEYCSHSFLSKLMIALSLIMCALAEHNCVLKSLDTISCKKGKPAVLSARDCAMVRHQCATR